MKRNYLREFVIVFFVSSVCFLLISCEEQSSILEQSKSPQLDSQRASGIKQPTQPPQKSQDVKPQAGGSAAPKITFEKVVCDLGEIAPRSNNSCDFEFKNTGNALLKIQKVKTCCGFRHRLKDNKTEYAPGESGVVTIMFSARKSAGNLKKHQYVHSNDKIRPKVELTVKAKIVIKIGYEPKKLNLLLNKANAGCPEITLKSLDAKPFSIKRFKSTANCITADFDSSVEDTKFVLKPKVDIEKLQKGLNGRIEITLTHPGRGSVVIPFSALARFTLNPPSIIIFDAEPEKPVKREVLVLNNYGEDFEVTSTSSQKGLMKVVKEEKIGKRYKFELEITPPPAKAKRKFFTDVFYINIKDGQKLQITFRGFYAKK